MTQDLASVQVTGWILDSQRTFWKASVIKWRRCNAQRAHGAILLSRALRDSGTSQLTSESAGYDVQPDFRPERLGKCSHPQFRVGGQLCAAWPGCVRWAKLHGETWCEAAKLRNHGREHRGTLGVRDR
jgi:hypothetical protein